MRGGPLESRFRKVNVGLLHGLTAKVVNIGGTGPVCQLCDKTLDSEEIVETQGTRVRVLGKHHGLEEAAWFDLGTEHWDHEDLGKALRGHPWFVPETKAAGQLTHAGQVEDEEGA